MASTLDILRRLVEHGVDFVLVGGMAATVHGSTLVTEDVDVCTRFELDNLERLIRALSGLHPRQRSQVDFLGAVTGVGAFQDVARSALALDLGGFECKVMGLEDLIKAKRALGRDKDLRVAIELERVLERARK